MSVCFNAFVIAEEGKKKERDDGTLTPSEGEEGDGPNPSNLKL